MNLQPRKLTADEKKEISYLKEQEGYEALLQHIQNILHADRQRIFTEQLDLDNPSRIALIKAQIEGAEKFAATLLRSLDNIVPRT